MIAQQYVGVSGGSSLYYTPLGYGFRCRREGETANDLETLFVDFIQGHCFLHTIKFNYLL